MRLQPVNKQIQFAARGLLAAEPDTLKLSHAPSALQLRHAAETSNASSRRGNDVEIELYRK